MKKLLVVILLVPMLCFAQQEQTFSRKLKLMGCAFEISVVHTDKDYAEECIDKAITEIERIESLISAWKDDSQTSQIIKNAGIEPVVVNQELFQLIERSLTVSELTNGAFDISFAGIDKLFTFNKQEECLPHDSIIASAAKHIGFENIKLDKDESSAFLAEKNMKIGFGAIGKGYAAERAKKILTEMGIENGVIDASGDLLAWGKQPKGKAWSVGIMDPEDRNKIIAWLDADDKAIVTSGDYEKYFTCNGKRYSHIIDPRTGYPVSGIKSVTIISLNAEVADAMATAVFVMGEKDGLALVEQLNGIECLIVNEKNEIITSKGLQINYTTDQ